MAAHPVKVCRSRRHFRNAEAGTCTDMATSRLPSFRSSVIPKGPSVVSNPSRAQKNVRSRPSRPMKSPSSNTTLSRGAIFVSPRDFVASSLVATMMPYSYNLGDRASFPDIPYLTRIRLGPSKCRSRPTKKAAPSAPALPKAPRWTTDENMRFDLHIMVSWLGILPERSSEVSSFELSQHRMASMPKAVRRINGKHSACPVSDSSCFPR